MDLRNAPADVIYEQSVWLRGSGGRKTANRCYTSLCLSVQSRLQDIIAAVCGADHALVLQFLNFCARQI